MNAIPFGVCVLCVYGFGWLLCGAEAEGGGGESRWIISFHCRQYIFVNENNSTISLIKYEQIITFFFWGGKLKDDCFRWFSFEIGNTDRC